MSSRLAACFGAAAFMLFAMAPATRAQEPASSPFRAGQIGVNIAVDGLTFSSVDLLKFTSPTRAWVVSASGFGTSQHSSGGLSPTTMTNEAISVSLQRRLLRPSHDHVVLYLSPGIQAGFSHANFSSSLPTVSIRSWDVGVLLEAGAEYVIGTHLGIGARYRASLTYDRLDAAGTRLWSVDASAGDFGAFGALFF